MQYVRFDGEKWSPDWPQDTLDIPSGQGVMPPINSGNRDVSRRESFTYTGEIVIPVSTPANSVFNLNIPTDQDGDFWCNQIYCQGHEVVAGVASLTIPVGRVHIGDIRTGQYLTYPAPGVSLGFFVGGNTDDDDPAFPVNSATFPSGFRATGTLIQPFCFTRQGGITITYTQLSATAANELNTIYFSFGGWKEYVYAAR